MQSYRHADARRALKPFPFRARTNRQTHTQTRLTPCPTLAAIESAWVIKYFVLINEFVLLFENDSYKVANSVLLGGKL